MHFWTPQTGENGPDNGGESWIYQYFRNSIRGFRQTHQCSCWTRDYGAFSLMPVCGKLEVMQDKRAATFRHENETALPHHYKVVFDNKITAEMTPVERGVQMRFRFPRKESYVVVDAWHIDLANEKCIIKIIPEERKITGWGKLKTPTAIGNRRISLDNFYNYFVIVFDKPFTTYGTWDAGDGSIFVEHKEIENGGAYIRFKDGETVQAKIASSYISVEQAERTLQQELGNNGFDDTKNAARNAWNKVLNRVQVEGGDEAQKATFYSCFFRSMLFPRKFYEYDADGNPYYFSPYDGKIHTGTMYTDNGLWDTFRAQFPLNALLHPDFHGRYIRSLLDVYEQSGWLPSWSFPGHHGSMIGNHALSLLADAYVKGFRFDSVRAMEAVLHEVSGRGPLGPANGRDGWRDYFITGYVPYPKYGEATAKTLEYCYNDWCAMQLASLSGQDFYKEIFQRHIFNYKNVYDPSTRFMRGRKADGTWVPDFDPTEWGGPFTEGCAWHYHWSVFHDIQGLIDLMDGESNFTAKLDSVFSEPNTFKVGTYGRVIHEMAEMAMINMGQYAHGNQPAQHIIYLYNYAGQPWKTQKWAREVMNRLYNAGPDGYCGDEDQGQTSSWYVISAMGLYAVCPGTDEYVIGSPLFPKMTIHLENGKTLIIEAENNSPENVYIQSATFNDKPFTRNYLRYDELMNGGTVRYRMGAQPAINRGINNEDKPFSVSKRNLTMSDE
jgi:predicted alpha-1,2-mannosidase